MAFPHVVALLITKLPEVWAPEQMFSQHMQIIADMDFLAHYGSALPADSGTSPEDTIRASAAIETGD